MNNANGINGTGTTEQSLDEINMINRIGKTDLMKVFCNGLKSY
jgi:hypothetical protein